MANPVPAGSDVSAGTYRCTSCGYELRCRIHPSSAALPQLWQRQPGHAQRHGLRQRPLSRPSLVDHGSAFGAGLRRACGTDGSKARIRGISRIS
jgi:hypothetical protein